MASRTKNAALTYDDLTAIKGIREARQQWFRDTMHVQTYGDLAALSVDQIESGLKAERQFPSRSMIEAWIAQAKALAETADDMAPSVQRQSASKEPTWEPFASFVIEFQVLDKPDGTQLQRTSVHHIENDKNQLWFGLERHESMKWMLAEAGIDIQPEETPPKTEAEKLPSPPSHPTKFSPELEQALAKRARISGLPLAAEYSPEPTRSPAQQKVSPARPTGFSDKLQEILARTQRHNSKTR